MPRLPLVLGLLLGLLIAPASASAKIVYETYRAPTVGGAEIAVEVMRDDAAKRAPVLTTSSRRRPSGCSPPCAPCRSSAST